MIDNNQSNYTLIYIIRTYKMYKSIKLITGSIGT